MTQHKHAEMIKAKVDNMDLVVFIKCQHKWKKQDCNDDQLNFSCGHEYFLCHPKRADACLHWLNGGEVENLGSAYFYPFLDPKEWVAHHLMMNPDAVFRIKPRKEKRFIATDGEHVRFANEGEIHPNNWQLIEIEVEV